MIMKKFLLFILLSFFLLSCTKPKFEVLFDLPESVHAAYTFTYYASSAKQGKWIETGVMVQGGRGKMTLPVANPAVVALSAGGNVIYFYVERGNNVKIKGGSADIFSWEIGGNSINEDWSKWRRANAGAIGGGNAEKINKAVADYVKKNPENPLSALLLLYEYDRKEDNEGFLSLWKSLKGEAAKEKWITISGRTDLYANSPLTPPDLKRKHTIILKSLVNGADTIITGKVPVAILFWRNSDNDRTKMIDSLKALRKAHPDSASFIIADVCFDPDSISWASPLGRDSLEHTIRAWNPMAEADSVIRSLGVEKTPALITFPAIKQTVKKATDKKGSAKKSTDKKATAKENKDKK